MRMETTMIQLILLPSRDLVLGGEVLQLSIVLRSVMLWYLSLWVLVQKKEPLKFKIYIVRANEFATADGAVSLLNVEVCNKGKQLLKEESAGELKLEEVPKVHGDIPCIDANGIVSETIDGIRMLDSDNDFEDVTSFSNFSIIVDRLAIDCKFHDRLRRTYYELCCSQKAFLHKHLLKQLNLTLVVGVILETISIAEGIRACKAEASSSCEDLRIWKKTMVIGAGTSGNILGPSIWNKRLVEWSRIGKFCR